MNEQEKLINAVMALVKEQSDQITRVAKMIDDVAALVVEVAKLIDITRGIAQATEITPQDKTPSIYPRNKKEVTTVIALVVFALAVLAIILSGSLSCSRGPDPFHLVDAGPDLDTDTDTDTDTAEFCPWYCRNISQVPEFTCSEYDFPDVDPSEVWNPNFPCEIPDYKCCQPWPPIDDQSIGDYCNDFGDHKCTSPADCAAGDVDKTKICFNASIICCREGGINDDSFGRSKTAIRQN